MPALDAKKRNALPARQFAFEKERKEPLENASHVRNAIARFNQVEGVSDADRDAAWKRIGTAAKKFGVDVAETSWREIGAGAKNAAAKKAPAKKAAAKKVAAKKAPAKKVPAKKAATKKAPARKTAARST